MFPWAFFFQNYSFGSAKTFVTCYLLTEYLYKYIILYGWSDNVIYVKSVANPFFFYVQYFGIFFFYLG